MKRWIFLTLWGAIGLSMSAQCPTCLSDQASGCTYTISGNVSNPSFNLNGNDRLCIQPGANVSGNWNININSATARIVNMGNISLSGLNLNTGILINYGRITVTGNITIGAAQVHNHNFMRAQTDFNLNGTSAQMCNSDTILVGNNMNTSGRVTNNGVIRVNRTFQQNADGDWCTTTYGLVYCDDLVLNGDVFGGSAQCVGFIVTDQTTVNGAGTISGTVDVCDLNYTLPISPRIDLLSGSIGANVTYCGCSQVPLSLLHMRAWLEPAGEGWALNWRSANAPAGLNYAVQQLVDGDFATFLQESGRPGTHTYHVQLPTGIQAGTVLRIHARDENGTDVTSPLNVVVPQAFGRLTVNAYPQPADAHLHLQVMGTAGAPFRIEIFDLVGRPKWEGNFESMGNGSCIAVPGVDQWEAGAYCLRVSALEKTQSSMLFIRQSR